MFRKKPAEEAAEHPLPHAEASAPRAPAVREKLDCALGALAELEEQVAELALDAAERKPGAADKLAGHRSKIEAAKTAVDELRAALRLAVKLDRRSDAAAAATMRVEQFSIMKQRAEVRLKAVATIMEAVATAAKAYNEYALATNQMVVAIPTGTRLGQIHIGRNGYGGSWIGDLKDLIASEAYRVAPIDAHGRGARLPFANAPEITSTDPGKFPPAIDLMTDAQQAVLRDIEGQMQRLNAECLAATEEAA